MLTTQRTIICISNTSHSQKIGRRSAAAVALAKKKDFSENSTTSRTISSLKLSKRLLAQSAVAVFALGFIDAGYSGDWSRIGVLSRENEDLLKSAAFIVVPLCFSLIFSFSKKFEDR